MLSSREEDFVRAQRVARMATADARGRPFAVPVCFVYLNGCLYTPVDEKPKSGRRRNRRRCAWASRAQGQAQGDRQHYAARRRRVPW